MRLKGISDVGLKRVARLLISSTAPYVVKKWRTTRPDLSSSEPIPLEEVEFEVLHEPDEDSFYSSDNDWIGCRIQVTAFWGGPDEEEHLGASSIIGGCSYKSVEDFKQDPIYEDLKQEAYEDLYLNVLDYDPSLLSSHPEQGIR